MVGLPIGLIVKDYTIRLSDYETIRLLYQSDKPFHGNHIDAGFFQFLPDPFDHLNCGGIISVDTERIRPKIDLCSINADYLSLKSHLQCPLSNDLMIFDC